MTVQAAGGRRPAQHDVFIFDLYGTLVDIHTDENQPSLWQRVAGFAASHGAGWEPAALRSAYLRLCREADARLRERDRPVPGACPEIDLAPVFSALYAERGVRADEAMIAETARIFRRASTTRLRAYAGAPALLRALRDRGRRVCLLSNAQGLFTRPELAELGLADAFDGIYISSEASFKKPDHRFFRLLLTREGLDASRCLMIGNDPLCDGAGARAVGMDTYLIRSALSPRELRAGYDQAGMDLRRLGKVLLGGT